MGDMIENAHKRAGKWLEDEKTSKRARIGRFQTRKILKVGLWACLRAKVRRERSLSM